MTHRGVMWGAAALLGIVAAAALAWSASQLARQRIGLLSAPQSFASGLAPSQQTPPRHRVRQAKPPKRQPSQRPAPGATAAVTLPSTPAYAGSSHAGSTAPAAPSSPSPAASSGAGSPTATHAAAATTPTSTTSSFSQTSASAPPSSSASSAPSSSRPHDDNRGGSGGSGSGSGSGDNGRSHRDD